MKRELSTSDSNMPVIDSKKLKPKETQFKPTVRLTSKQRKRQAKSEKKRKTQVCINECSIEVSPPVVTLVMLSLTTVTVLRYSSHS